MPSRAQSVALFDQLVRDIERLDGDGLTIRHLRPEPWKDTVARLRVAANAANTPAALGQVFHRLRASYPNFHANVTLNSGYNEKWMLGGTDLPIAIRAETLAPNVSRPIMRVATVNATWLKSQSPGAALPAEGDVVVALNQRPIADWLRENEIFCRYPLAAQCAVEFQRNLVRGLLFWQPGTSLTLTVQRNGREVQATVHEMPATTAPALAPNATGPAQASATVRPVPCESAKPRMPSGFALAWAGRMVYVFANPDQPDTQIWRIESFIAEQSRVFNAEPGQFRSVEQETDAFYDQYWKATAPQVRHLIIDIAGNGGGEVVVRWHQLLFPSPFQMPFVAFKKIREFDQPNVRQALFWGSAKSQEFVAAMRRDGSFETVATGDWLPAQQAFCFFNDYQVGVSCNDVRHVPRAHGFTGRVTLVLDHFCHSACVMFARTTKDKLNARVVGLPDNGDTTFSRLQVHFGFDAKGVPVTAVEDATAITHPVGRFTVAATRFHDDRGNILSAKPLMPDLVVPRSWKQSGDAWALEAIKAALTSPPS